MDLRVTVTARVVAPCRAIATLMGGFFKAEKGQFIKNPLSAFLRSHLYDALICLTACYPKKFGPRGIGHAGVVFIGLQCDIDDEGYETPV